MSAPQKIFDDRPEYRTADKARDGFKVLDPRFRELIGDSPKLEKHWTGCEWAEGPAYLADENALVWSDVPNNRMLRFDAGTGETIVFREPSNFSNGNSTDPQGRLITCEHQAHRISRREADGTVATLVDSYEGKRLNSPNDLVAKSDGSIWFTDPPYGILSDREGDKRESDLDGNYLFRLDPSTGALEIASDEMDRPNGLAFSPDESILYVADTGEPKNMVAFDVGADGKTLSNRRVFAVVRPGISDGFRCDVNGNVWTSAHDGVQCYTPAGELIGKVLVPEQRTANCCWGDPDFKRLYITGDTSLYSVRLEVAGARLRG